MKSQIFYLQYLIFALLALTVILFFFGSIFSHSEERSRLNVCKSTVDLNTRMRISGFDFSKNIICPPKEVIITESEDNKINQQIAEEMVECWEIFRRGELELFTGTGVFCAVCSNIEFKDKEGNFEGFSKFLTETKMPFSQVSYAEYLAGYSTPEAVRVLDKELKDNPLFEEKEKFPKDRDYAVIFVYAKGKDKVESLLNFITQDTSNGQTGITAIGAGSAGFGLIFLGALSAPAGSSILIVEGINILRSFIYDLKTTPEWSAITIFSEYSPEKIDEMGCTYLPAER